MGEEEFPSGTAITIHFFEVLRPAACRSDLVKEKGGGVGGGGCGVQRVDKSQMAGGNPPQHITEGGKASVCPATCLCVCFTHFHLSISALNWLSNSAAPWASSNCSYDGSVK